MAYEIGNAFGKLDPTATLDEIIDRLSYSIPRKDFFKFLRGLEDAYAQIGFENNQEGFIEKAAKIAVKNFDLDVNLIGDPEIEGRIKKYEEKLTERGLYYRAAKIAALMPWDSEALDRIKSYAAKDRGVYDIMRGDKKVFDILTKDERDLIDTLRNLDSNRENSDTPKGPSL
jgi:hypothetical protein